VSSLANLEHHHSSLKGTVNPAMACALRRSSLSFGDGIVLKDGDWMEVRYEGFGGAAKPDPNRAQRTQPSWLLARLPDQRMRGAFRG
jgi:hypothetical protein